MRTWQLTSIFVWTNCQVRISQRYMYSVYISIVINHFNKTLKEKLININKYVAFINI